MKSKINRDNITYHLLEMQLGMIGKSLAQAADEEDWYHSWSIPASKQEVFKEYAIKLIKKTFKCNRKKAEDAFNWYDLVIGLKVKH